MDRRTFMKSSSLFVLGLSFGSLFKKAAAIAADALPAGKTACSNADPVASALGYVAVAKDIDKKKYKQFKKLAKDHDCKGCELYTAISGGYGNCTMLTNCVVAEKGLCGSWQKRVKKG